MSSETIGPIRLTCGMLGVFVISSAFLLLVAIAFFLLTGGAEELGLLWAMLIYAAVPFSVVLGLIAVLWGFFLVIRATDRPVGPRQEYDSDSSTGR